MSKKRANKILSVLLALALVAGTTGMGALEASASVDPVHNVTQDTYYGTIQGAVDAAQEGDVIEVAPGNYFESVTVDVNGLTIQSTGGKDVTGLSGGDFSFKVEVKDFTLDGFSLMPNEWGVLVLGVEDGDITLENCLFTDAMYSVLFNTIDDTKINLVNNVILEAYRGFYFEGAATGADITVSGNSISGLQAEGAIVFYSPLKGCTVDISQNTITHAVKGVYARSEIKDTQFDVTGNTITGGIDGIHTVDSGDGVCGTSVLTVEDNTFSHQSDSAVYVEYVEGNGSAVITDNSITRSDYAGISIDYVGYSYPDAPASVTITGNTIVDSYEGVDLYDICYGSVLVQENVIQNAYYGVYIDYSADESVTDVQILDNTITLDENTDSCYAGVYVYSAEKDLLISGNTITGYSDYLEYGIYLEYIGYYGAEASEVEISDNAVSQCGTGIYLYDVADEMDAAVTVMDNEVMDTAYGVYIENMDSYAAAVDLTGNLIHGNGYGVYLEDMYGEVDYEVVLTLNGNIIMDNETGITLEYIYLVQEIPGIEIMDNAIVENGTGISLGTINAADNGLVLIKGNNISGNESYGLAFLDDIGYTAPALAPQLTPINPEYVLQAQWNWWGDASGPEYMGNGAAGDAVSGSVDFDPWIKELVISPKDSSGYKGTERTFTATLLDSNGDPVDLPLTVLFQITGANAREGSAVLEDGKGTFTYSGEEGTDTVAGGLVFAGALVEDLTADTSAVWLAAVEGNPDTGDDGGMQLAMFLSLMALAGAAGALGFRRKTEN